MPTITELIRVLPEETGEAIDSNLAALPHPLAELSLRPVPVGRARRLGALASLQARIAAAYLFYWMRGWFQGDAERSRQLTETHWKTALRLLDSMGYMRGAVMKVGQTLANFPDIAPKEFVETLERLRFDAPPMHWSLLREMVHNELGDDPENIFASFEKRAFAAASLGQVHGACLRSGQNVALKIQYPGIGRTIGEDFRNLSLFLLPGRLDKDWENVKAQMEDLQRRLEAESDYKAEAAAQMKSRSLFKEADGIVVPEVYPDHSTARVLTMERLDGVHLPEFLKGNPSQEQRNDAARKIIRAWYRLLFAGRMVYADIHPGNFLFLKDGRLGLLDFGFMVSLDDELWALFARMDRALTTGRREDRMAAIKEWSWITDDANESERLRLTEQWADWCWRSRYCGGAFDFGDEADFRRGINLFSQLVAKRYSRARPCTPAFARNEFGLRSMLYRLQAKFDVRALCEEEVTAAGWDRSDYT